jgi:mono/diheme cytochrome c family protein
MKLKRAIGHMCIILLSTALLSSCTSNGSADSGKPGPATLPAKDDPNKGQVIFLSRCASCHKVNQDMTGPALAGAETSWPDKKKLYAFIRNSQEVIQYDPYARTLWLEYNQTIMPPWPDLSDEDIRAILDYIASQAQK